MASIYRLKDLGANLAPGVQIIKAAEFSAVETAEQIIATAQKRADEILQDATRVHEEQKIQGYEDGVRKAQSEACERLMAEQALLDARLREIEHDVVTVTITMLRRLLDEYDDADHVRLMARSMLKTLRSEKRVRLHVAPEMYSQTVAMTRSITDGFKQVEFLEIVEDGDLEGTNIVLEAPVGRVDGNLQVRLQEIEEILRRTISVPSAAKSVGDGL
ncbi:type III secretion system stator protein SctL [Pseudovibrio sp. Tun.PSC04-5.I4]|uniref:type III secretion system stator protein SctL n=1 Tax=Pseudovibrio sp. Tun.PSC04-5.I4 TaxID=1798213 RepID=UPI00088C6C17|nr:type III secretion system stator protein SctL [Pseudovibrio sp. Tun.PSC04-5.I4]SDR14745.1 type III secretion protein L [Pseudovibrio sp. Tun.PSC04-5.I4]